MALHHILLNYDYLHRLTSRNYKEIIIKFSDLLIYVEVLLNIPRSLKLWNITSKPRNVNLLLIFNARTKQTNKHDLCINVVGIIAVYFRTNLHMFCCDVI
jgi:hypothetical protein